MIDAPGSPDGKDAALRPNQIFAVSLPETALTPEQQRAVVDVCARELLTSFGLRSLARTEAGYRGRYAGSPEERDAAYHQGTVWGWLLGPFALAHLRVYQNADLAMSFLEPMFQPHQGRRAWHGQRNFRRRSAVHAERLHRASMDGRRNFAGVASNRGSAG